MEWRVTSLADVVDEAVAELRQRYEERMLVDGEQSSVLDGGGSSLVQGSGTLGAGGAQEEGPDSGNNGNQLGGGLGAQGSEQLDAGAGASGRGVGSAAWAAARARESRRERRHANREARVILARLPSTRSGVAGVGAAAGLTASPASIGLAIGRQQASHPGMGPAEHGSLASLGSGSLSSAARGAGGFAPGSGSMPQGLDQGSSLYGGGSSLVDVETETKAAMLADPSTSGEVLSFGFTRRAATRRHGRRLARFVRMVDVMVQHSLYSVAIASTSWLAEHLDPRVYQRMYWAEMRQRGGGLALPGASEGRFSDGIEEEQPDGAAAVTEGEDLSGGGSAAGDAESHAALGGAVGPEGSLGDPAHFMPQDEATKAIEHAAGTVAQEPAMAAMQALRSLSLEGLRPAPPLFAVQLQAEISEDAIAARAMADENEAARRTVAESGSMASLQPAEPHQQPGSGSPKAAKKGATAGESKEQEGEEEEQDSYVRKPPLGTDAPALEPPLAADDEYEDTVRHNGNRLGLGLSPASDLVTHRLEHVLFQGVRVVSSVPSLLAHADFQDVLAFIVEDGATPSLGVSDVPASGAASDDGGASGSGSDPASQVESMLLSTDLFTSLADKVVSHVRESYDAASQYAAAFQWLRQLALRDAADTSRLSYDRVDATSTHVLRQLIKSRHVHHAWFRAIRPLRAIGQIDIQTT